MSRVFEKRLGYLQSIEQKIIDNDFVTTQYIFDETTEEAEKRLQIKICNELRKKTRGEIKGHVWKEYSDNIREMGWHSTKEFIRERMGSYTEISLLP